VARPMLMSTKPRPGRVVDAELPAVEDCAQAPHEMPSVAAAARLQQKTRIAGVMRFTFEECLTGDRVAFRLARFRGSPILVFHFHHVVFDPYRPALRVLIEVALQLGLHLPDPVDDPSNAILQPFPLHSELDNLVQ